MDNLEYKEQWLTDNLEREFGSLNLSDETRVFMFDFLQERLRYLDITPRTPADKLADYWQTCMRSLVREIQVLGIMQQITVTPKDTE